MQAGGEATRGASCLVVSLPHEVVGEALADDARTATPPRGVVENVMTSPPVADARVGTARVLLRLRGLQLGTLG
jgi:hypothetical protein